MRRPPAEDPGSINYHALEGGGWHSTDDAHEEKVKRPQGTSIVTRVIIVIIVIALVSGRRCRLR